MAAFAVAGVEERGICFLCALKVKQILQSRKNGATSG
jgi:hypothetical protein